MTSLTITDLTVDYPPDTRAVDGLTLEVGDGERLVLLGPSGCGKTTILRAIAGLATPTAGDVQFDGRSVLETPPEKRGAVMVFQEHALLPFRTVAENIGFGLEVRRVTKAERSRRVGEALELVQLPGLEARWPSELSGGQRQRVALARALVVEPALLLLDEPLSNLDQHLREELGQAICDIQRRVGITTVMVTHDQLEAAAVADRVAVIVGGRLRQIGTPEELTAAPADDDVSRYFAPARLSQ